MTPLNLTDRAIRAITNDGAFRIITIRTTDTVRKAIAAHGVRGEDARTFAELLTGAVLARETMSPDNRLQMILKPTGADLARIRMVADSHPEGLTRGLVYDHHDGEGELELGEGTLLQVVRVLYNKELQQGLVETTRDAGISGALNNYMLNSEQVTSVIEVAAHLEGDEVVSASGFIVQLLPEVSVEVLAPMLAYLENRPALRELLEEREVDPAHMMELLMQDFEHTLLSEEPVFFGCLCSQERIVQAMATLGVAELRKIVEEDGRLEVECEYCKTPYVLGAVQLSPLLYSN